MLSFHVKFVQTDTRTDNGKTICPPPHPDLSKPGQKKSFTGLEILLKPFQNKQLLILCVSSASLLKTLWEKKKIARNEQFLLFPSVFNLLGELSTIFIKFQIVVYKLFLFGRVQNLLFGKGCLQMLSI